MSNFAVNANAKATHIFFNKNISIYAILNDQNFNNSLTNNIVSSEQLGPGLILLPGTPTFQTKFNLGHAV